jgi:hypothetical protein
MKHRLRIAAASGYPRAPKHEVMPPAKDVEITLQSSK